MLLRSLQSESSEKATEGFFRACQRNGRGLQIRREMRHEHLASETRTIRVDGLIALDVIELAVIELDVTCIDEIGVVALGIHRCAAVGVYSVAVCKLISRPVAMGKHQTKSNTFYDYLSGTIGRQVCCEHRMVLRLRPLCVCT